MNKKFMQECMARVAEAAQNMSFQNQEQFVSMLAELAPLYRDDATAKAVLAIATPDGQMLIRINADEFEAHGIIYNIIPFDERLLRADQPQGELH